MFMKRWMEAIIRNGRLKVLKQDKHRCLCLDILGHDTLGRDSLIDLANLDVKLQMISMKQLLK